tara:strand:- start:619 stop:1710 length:1092 start_codon:yes stop_codon:yes gene_type:complete
MRSIINKLKFTILFIWNQYINFSLKFIKIEKFKYKKKLNILFIKPKNYLNLYQSCGANFKDIIFSSLYRFGPVGLFTEFKTNFIISNFDYKVNYLENNNIRKKILLSQKKKAHNLKKINFDNYDLVILFEDIIDHSSITKYKKTLWAIMYEDHSNEMYKKSIYSKPKKYDIILNQTLGFTPYSIFRQIHWIDFSYTLGNSNFNNKCNLKLKKNIDIIVEVNQKKYIKKKISNLKEYKKLILDESYTFHKYLRKLMRGSFFLAIDCNLPRWGNSLIEAALCQNLIIANKNHFWNSQIVLEELNVNNLNKALKIISRLKNDKKLYKRLLLKQNKLLDYLNFTRPMYQIRDYALKSNRSLNIKNKF